MAISSILEKEIAMQVFLVFFFSHCTQTVLQMFFVPLMQNEYWLGVGFHFHAKAVFAVKVFCLWALNILLHSKTAHSSSYKELPSALEIQPSHKKVPSLLTAGKLWLSSFFSFPFLEGQWHKETGISHHFWAFFYYVDKPVAFITEILPWYAKQPLSS